MNTLRKHKRSAVLAARKALHRLTRSRFPRLKEAPAWNTIPRFTVISMTVARQLRYLQCRGLASFTGDIRIPIPLEKTRAPSAPAEAVAG